MKYEATKTIPGAISRIWYKVSIYSLHLGHVILVLGVRSLIGVWSSTNQEYLVLTDTYNCAHTTIRKLNR